MDEFPRMLYLTPGPEPMHGGMFSTLIVGDADEQADALARGWALTTPDALALKAEADARAKAPDQAPADDAPPTRAELEQKAAELGLKFDGRTSDKKLRDLIAATLED